MMPIEMTERKQAIRMLPTPPAIVRQRIQNAADELNRVGAMAMRVELVNEALCKFVHMLYAKDGDGDFANMDSVTGRLLVPAPWGSVGWRKWGLRKYEGMLLRAVLLARLAAQRAPLFDYSTQVWFVNRGIYKSVTSAQNYLETNPISLSEWRFQTRRYLEAEAERKRKPVG